MATAIGEDMIVNSVMKSTCVSMCHMSSSVIFFGGQMVTSGRVNWWWSVVVRLVS